MAMKIMGLVVYNVAWAEAYLPTKWYLDPSSRLATTDNFAALNRGRHLYSAITLGIGPHSSIA